MLDNFGGVLYKEINFSDLWIRLIV